MALCEKIVFGQRILGYFILVFIAFFFMCVLNSSHAYDKNNFPLERNNISEKACKAFLYVHIMYTISEK